MNNSEVIKPWLSERNIEDVEAFVPDMAGAARGKVIPADKFGTGSLKLPESIFQQTVSGDYVDNPNNVEDRDMLLAPDPTTLRPVPWASDPAALIFLDCYRSDGMREIVYDLKENGHETLIRKFVASVEKDSDVPVPPQEAIDALSVSLAALKSIESGKKESV